MSFFKYKIYLHGGIGCQILDLLIGIEKAIIKQIDNQVGDVPYTCADIELSKKELNYNPKVDLETGLTKLKEWLIEYKNISI